MFNLSDTCKKLICVTAVCALILYFLGIATILMGILNESILAFTLGAVFGSVFTFLKIMLLEKSVQKAVNMSPEDSRNYMRANYMSRYFLTGVVVLVAIFVKNISLIGVILGLFSMTPAAFITGKLEKDK